MAYFFGRVDQLKGRFCILYSSASVREILPFSQRVSRPPSTQRSHTALPVYDSGGDSHSQNDGLRPDRWERNMYRTAWAKARPSYIAKLSLDSRHCRCPYFCSYLSRASPDRRNDNIVDKILNLQ